MMNEQIIQNLATDALITGGIMGVCFTVAVGILVNLAWASQQRQSNRMYKLEDEVLKLKQFKRQVEMDERFSKFEKTGVN